MKSLEQQIEEVKKVPGNVKGEAIKTIIPYIKKRKGEEGLKKVLKEANKFGVLIDLEEIKPLRMYPGYMPMVIILIAKDIFNWSDDDIFEMGYYSLRISFLIKFVITKIISVETIFKNAPNYWKKHYDFGEFIPLELNKKEKYMIVATKGDDFHPLLCRFHAGYFKSLLMLVVNSDDVHIEETKCVHRGDEHHEYKLTW